ncbi:unnamed protein product [Clonostachys byssicola]|uniref:Uncharacterized protein n=1 Tax=Clonostachys byssicola TaxID=160290 RepID=A0A9N9UET0_9HYPO|nr:unnamed protein product [Clonostachys byssicola]
MAEAEMKASRRYVIENHRPVRKINYEKGATKSGLLPRHPEKISAERFEKLESFVKATSYYDIPAIEKACAGVDNGAPYPQLDGQLILLRAAERAG